MPHEKGQIGPKAGVATGSVLLDALRRRRVEMSVYEKDRASGQLFLAAIDEIERLQKIESYRIEDKKAFEFLRDERNRYQAALERIAARGCVSIRVCEQIATHALLPNDRDQPTRKNGE